MWSKSVNMTSYEHKRNRIIRKQEEPIVELGKIYTFNKWLGREVQEDSLLNEDVLRLISRYYGSIFKIVKHSKVNGKEIDAIVYCTTTSLKIPRFLGIRTVGIELKETHLVKVVEQAIERRPFFDYFYVVTGATDRKHRYIGWDIEKLYRENLLGKMLDKKIGWILNTWDSAHVIFPSKFKPTKLREKWKEWIK